MRANYIDSLFVPSNRDNEVVTQVAFLGLRPESVRNVVEVHAGEFFERDQVADTVTALRWFDSETADALLRCYRADPNYPQRVPAVRALRSASRVLPR